MDSNRIWIRFLLKNDYRQKCERKNKNQAWKAQAYIQVHLHSAVTRMCFQPTMASVWLGQATVSHTQRWVLDTEAHAGGHSYFSLWQFQRKEVNNNKGLPSLVFQQLLDALLLNICTKFNFTLLQKLTPPKPFNMCFIPLSLKNYSLPLLLDTQEETSLICSKD